MLSATSAGKPIRHLRNVLKSCPKDAVLGIDQQVLPLWANLPDDALKGLHLIIRAMLDGKCPLQARLVLIGFLGKEGGGERPIGLTAMLYRFVMRLYKGIICSWDKEFHAHWDYAVKKIFMSQSCSSQGPKARSWCLFQFMHCVNSVGYPSFL